jgi:hypothetical protein
MGTSKVRLNWFRLVQKARNTISKVALFNAGDISSDALKRIPKPSIKVLFFS